MQIAGMRFRWLRFPDPAGALQDRGATASLVRELGRNYTRYHTYLAEELSQMERPAADDYDDVQAYFADWTKIEEILKAEALLRNCRSFMLDRRRLDAALDPTVPLVDSTDRLVSVEEAAP
jgi:hypothetical protein